MGASALEFRLRLAINVVIIVLGFWSPWIEQWGVGRRISLLEWLALELSRTGIASFTVATPIVIVVGSLIAALGAFLRVWGTAYLGSATMLHPQMQAGAVMAAGPYRYVRNPLYLGTWFMVAAMAFIMPPTGALLTMVLVTIFQLRLIFGEEPFLLTQLGDSYRAYLRAVPRLVPRLRTNVPRSDAKPHWGLAALSEITPIGVFVTLACLSWSYNHWLMLKGIVVAFGLSLLLRAFLPQQQSTPQP
ncbi:MAG TPA: isoprenylcysteine carboxylmethyltransferase family protein [Terracidiphilus sp.]|jgi:protein-S-isoprenylcysteine O-methyltransferase Ste14|nr:isoprenylcysteine carboxylmethyltransferase family protein [Terracidiphilus sp.]